VASQRQVKVSVPVDVEDVIEDKDDDEDADGQGMSLGTRQDADVCGYVPVSKGNLKQCATVDLRTQAEASP
jgi:hypothetical protein